MSFCLLVCQMCGKGTFSQIRSHISWTVLTPSSDSAGQNKNNAYDHFNRVWTTAR